MADSIVPVNWAEFPGLRYAVINALAYAKEIVITPDERHDPDTADPTYLPPQPHRRATVVVTVEVPWPLQ